MFVFALVIFSLRILYLDQDLPPWGITNYQPIDEGTYSILALNLVNYGSISVGPPESLFRSYIPPHSRVNIIGNALSFLMMELMGKNYYGYRLPSVLWASGIFVLLYLTLKETVRAQGSAFSIGSRARSWAFSAIALFVSLSFSFLMASRVVEPSIVRCFMNILILYLFLRLREKGPLRFLLVGFLSTISVFFVYISNVFIFFPSGIVLLACLFKNPKEGLRYSIFFIIGVAAAFCIIEPYYALVWGTEAVRNLFGAISDFSDVRGYTAPSSPKSIISNAFSFWGANIFLYSPLLMPLVVSSLLVLLLQLKRDESHIGLFLIGAIAGLFFQTLWSNDYIVRKNVVLFPYYLVLIFAGFLRFGFFKAELEERASAWGVKLSLLGVLCALLAFVVCSYVFVFRVIHSADRNSMDMEFPDKAVAAISGILSFVFAFSVIDRPNYGTASQIKGRTSGSIIAGAIIGIALVTIVLFFSLDFIRADARYSRKILLLSLFAIACVLALASRLIFRGAGIIRYPIALAIAATAFSCAPDIYMSAKYVYCKHTYTEKQVMVDLGGIANGEYVFGEYENGYSLYNSMKPILDTNANIREDLKHSEAQYFFDYYFSKATANVYFQKNVLKNSEYTVRLVSVFVRSYQAYGKSRCVALYEKVLKREKDKIYMLKDDNAGYYLYDPYYCQGLRNPGMIYLMNPAQDSEIKSDYLIRLRPASGHKAEIIDDRRMLSDIGWGCL